MIETLTKCYNYSTVSILVSNHDISNIYNADQIYIINMQKRILFSPYLGRCLNQA